jgi:hypothetical protein
LWFLNIKVLALFLSIDTYVFCVHLLPCRASYYIFQFLVSILQRVLFINIILIIICLNLFLLINILILKGKIFLIKIVSIKFLIVWININELLIFLSRNFHTWNSFFVNVVWALLASYWKNFFFDNRIWSRRIWI